MPIYQDVDGHPVVHLGVGDVVIALGRALNSPAEYRDELVFLEGFRAQAVGAACPEADGTMTQPGQAAVRVIFDTIAALDVVLAKLMELRQDLGGAHQG